MTSLEEKLEAVANCCGGVDIRMAADSTMLRMVNLLIALSFGVQREQLEQRIGLTCPRPFLLRPLDARFLTILADSDVVLVADFVLLCWC